MDDGWWVAGVGRRVAGDGLNADFLAMFGRRQGRSREMCKMEHLVSNLSIKSELRRHKEHRVFKRRGEMKIRTSKTPEPVYYHILCDHVRHQHQVGRSNWRSQL